MTAKDILLAVIIPLLLAEAGPWCGWLAARLLPLAARLRYGETERAAVRLEEWSADLGGIPGQLTKLAYAVGQLAAGSAVSARRKTKGALGGWERFAILNAIMTALPRADERYDRKLRKRIARLPLAERQRAAELLGYLDGMPLTERDIRMNIRRLRGLSADRERVRRTICPPHDVTKRRIGSLNPDEFGAIFEQEWP